MSEMFSSNGFEMLNIDYITQDTAIEDGFDGTVVRRITEDVTYAEDYFVALNAGDDVDAV